MKSSRSTFMAGALVLAALSLPSGAGAQTNEARAAFQAGVQAYAERHFAEALEAFRTAYRVRPHPSVLVNIANCYVALNRPQDAISTFERFLNDPTVNPSAQQRAEIQSALSEARSHLATINVLVFPPGAEVYLDGDLVGTAPLRRPLQTGPGPHVIEARQAGGGTVQHQARVEGGGAVTLTLDIVRNRSFIGSVAPEVRPPPPPPPPVVVVPPPPPAVVTPVPRVVPATNVIVAPRPPRVEPARPVATAPRLPVPIRFVDPSVTVRPPQSTQSSRGVGAGFWIGLSLTLATSGTAVGFFVYANGLEAEYYRIVGRFNEAIRDNNPSLQSYYRAQGLSYADAVDRNRLVSYIFGGVAGAAAVFTVGAAIYGAGGRSSPRGASLQVLPSLRGDGLTVSGTF